MDVIKKEIEKFARGLGFDLVGFSDAKLNPGYLTTYKRWLKKGMNGEMEYMEKKASRKNIEEILPGAKTVICLGMNYFYEQSKLKKGFGRVARYAYGRDYHKIILKKLKAVEAFIRRLDPEGRHRVYVDTGPILEKAYAEQAGLGFIGKNSCLITQEFGSWVFLGEIITTLKVEAKVQPWGGCGACKKCVEACPTGAILGDGTIDARKCISYLTIENKGEIPAKLSQKIKATKRLYGCDICQEVCPHNCRSKINTHPEFQTKIGGDQLNLQKILGIKSDDEFLKQFAGSPLMRAKKSGLQRNAKILSSS